jgi:hypothetical protein
VSFVGQVEGRFYVNKQLDELMFAELKVSAARKRAEHGRGRR